MPENDQFCAIRISSSAISGSSGASRHSIVSTANARKLVGATFAPIVHESGVVPISR